MRSLVLALVLTLGGITAAQADFAINNATGTFTVLKSTDDGTGAQQLGTVNPAIGTTTDSAWAGSGAGTLVSILKLVSGTLTTIAGQAVSAGDVDALSAQILSVLQPDKTSTGNSLNSATSNAAVTATLVGGRSLVQWTVTGLTAAGATLTSEGIGEDGSTAQAINCTIPGGANTSATTLTVDQICQVAAAGFKQVRLRVSSTGTGTITVGYRATNGMKLLSLLPGGNAIGTVIDTALEAVLGTTSGAAVVTDANGTIQQYLRGLVTLLGSTNPVLTYRSDSYLSIAAGTATTTVKSGSGTLTGICINTKGASSNTVTVYDNTAGSGTKIVGSLDTTNAVGCLRYEVGFGTGLTVVSATGTGADLTITYR